MGGYLAARSAAFEDRIAACILDGGVFDIYENYMQKAGELKKVIEDGNAEVANVAIETSMYFDITARWAFSHGTFGAKKPVGLFAKEQGLYAEEYNSEY